MVQRVRFVVLVVTVLLVTCTAVGSASTLSGVTGLINMPNADAIRSQTLEAGVHFSGQSASIHVGFSIVPQLELVLNTAGAGQTLGLGVKGVVAPESRDNPGIAVGLDNGSAYMVFSKNLSGLRGHIGFGNGRFEGLFGGVSLLLNSVAVSQPGKSAPATTLMVEHDGRGVNAGVRMAFTPQVRVDAAVLNMEDAMLGVSFSTRF